MYGPRPTRIDAERGREVALLALAHVSRDEALVQRFMATSGIEPDQVRGSIGDPAFLAGVLDFLLAHEPDAEAFAVENGLTPETLQGARAALTGGEPDAWQSI